MDGFFPVAREQVIEAIVGAEAAGIFFVERAGIAVEGGADFFEFGGFAFPIGAVGLGDELETLFELAEDFAFAGFIGVKFQAEGFEAFLLEAAMNDIEGGAFFGDEENSFTEGETVRDDVGDGLRFAGAGRSFEDEVVSGASGHDGGELGGVGAARAENFVGTKLVVELRRLYIFRRIGIRHAGFVNEMADDAIFGEGVEAINGRAASWI